MGQNPEAFSVFRVTRRRGRGKGRRKYRIDEGEGCCSRCRGVNRNKVAFFCDLITRC
ncbi:unnamed protein product [Musa acuminata subsp. burmannicoides]